MRTRFGLVVAGTLVAAGMAVAGGVRAAAPQDQHSVTVYKSPT
jgi:hypothetical protein